MKVCLYSPYVPEHFGGGEKHLFDVALEFAKKNDVSIALPPDASCDAVKSAYAAFMNQNLDSISFIHSPLFFGNAVRKLWWTRLFDYLYYVTDGSLFFTAAKKNNLHIQVPLQLDKSSLLERLKLWNWGIKNTNPQFTKSVIEASWNTKITTVLYPKVEIPKKLPKDREKIILHVGRFFRQLHTKRQDVLVDIFISLRERHPQRTRGWKLVLIGQVEDQSYFDELQKKATGHPIEFIPNASHQKLSELYKKAQIYWHATGYGVDETTYPEKVEHFGITTAEAMAHGLVPIVLGKGGQPEVIGSLGPELLWNTKEQCLAITAELLKDTKKRSEISTQARQEAHRFSPEVFSKTVEQMVK